MRRHATVVCAILGTIGLQVVGAQKQPGTKSVEVKVSGCVTQAQRTGSLADDTGAGVSATPATAPTEANSAEPLNAYLLTNASVLPAVSGDSKQTLPTSYALQGLEQELATHKGHRVEVAGQLLPPRETAGASTKPTAPGIQRIAVQSVRMLSSECPVLQKP
jgi:hypothetical protein